MKTLFRVMLSVIFIAVLVIVISYGRGYRFNFGNGSLTSTGIISVNSSPNAAKIYINGELKGATNSNLSLPPGKYQVEIKKDGYTSWSKSLILKGELVATVDALLFPLNPSLSPLTNMGITGALPIGQTEKIILFCANGDLEKDGVYIFDSSNRPALIFPPLKLVVLKQNLPETVDLARTDVYFSPDYKEGIFDFKDENNQLVSSYLFSFDEENQSLFDVATSKETLLNAWEEEKLKQTLKALETYPAEVEKIASSSFQIVSFSPDETKILYTAKKPVALPPMITAPLIGANQTPQERQLTADQLYVYDKKEDKNFRINLEFKIHDSILNSIRWYPDSKHLVINEGKRIIVADYDGTNKQTVYSALYGKDFFSATADGKVIVLANLNPEATKYPDLYLVGIR